MMMSTRIRIWAAVGVIIAALGGAPLALAQDAALLKDLTAVIALHGQACGEVVSAERRADNDYVASCKDGNRYRVFTNPQGRVVVEKA
jgi:hypothetical protein